MDQVKAMFNAGIVDVEQYHRISVSIKSYSDMALTKGTIRINSIQRNSILTFTHDLGMNSYRGYKKFHKIRNDDTIIK